MGTHAVGEGPVYVRRLVPCKLVCVADSNAEPRSIDSEVLEIENDIDGDNSSEEDCHSHGVDPSSRPSPRIEGLCVANFNVIVVIDIIIDIDLVGVEVFQ